MKKKVQCRNTLGILFSSVERHGSMNVMLPSRRNLFFIVETGELSRIMLHH